MKKLLFIFGLILSFLILGCGGVDSSSSENSSSNPDSNTTISGYVIDDPIVGATIEVYDEEGNLIAKEENATDESGKFEIEIPNITTDTIFINALANNVQFVTVTTKNNLNNIYITQYTTACKQFLDNLKIKNIFINKTVLDIMNEMNFVNGKPQNTNSAYYPIIKYIADNIQNAFHNQNSYSILTDNNLTMKSLTLSDGGIFDFSVDGYSDIKCDSNNLNNNILVVKNDTNETYNIICSAKKDNITYFFNISVSPSTSNQVTLSEDTKISNIGDISIIKPDDKNITVKSVDSPFIANVSGKTVVGNTILQFSPSGLKFDEPLIVKIPSSDTNATFYLTDENGNIEQIEANYTNGYYTLSIPHFSSVSQGNNYTNKIVNDYKTYSADYDLLKEKLLNDDMQYYTSLGDGIYAPKFLIDLKSYSTDDLKNNINIKALLELLVLKNGKGMIDFDGSSLTFTPNGISIEYQKNDNTADNISQTLDAVNKIYTLTLLTLLEDETVKKIIETSKNTGKDIISLLDLPITTIMYYDGFLDKYIEFRQYLLKLDSAEKYSKIKELLSMKEYTLSKQELILRRLKIEALVRDIKNNIYDYYKIPTFNTLEFLSSFAEYLNNNIPDSLKKSILPIINLLKKGSIKLDDFVNTYNNAFKGFGAGLGDVALIAKLYSIGLSYNFDKIENKIKVLNYLKTVLPNYSEQIKEVINELKSVSINEDIYGKWLTSYSLYINDSLLNVADGANDLVTFLTSTLSLLQSSAGIVNFTKIENTLGKILDSKGLGLATTFLDIAVSGSKWFSIRSEADSLAYLSTTASTLAYSAVNNPSLTPEEQLKWYAIFQSLSNYSLVSWYYFDGKMAEKGNNWLYTLSNVLDVGISAVANTVSTGNLASGLTSAAIKAVCNEQVVSAIWSIQHTGFANTFFHKSNDKDVIISNYLSRNAIYQLFATGKVNKTLSNKKDFSFIAGNIYKLNDGSKVLSFMIDKDLMDRFYIRLNDDSSRYYFEDLALQTTTQAPTIYWDFNGDNRVINSRFGGPTNIKQNSQGVVIFALSPDVKSIELLGWKYTKDGNTIAYYKRIELDNLDYTDYNENRILTDIEREISDVTGMKFYQTPDSIDYTKIYDYAKDNGYTFFNLNTGEMDNEVNYYGNWLAVKYYNFSHYAVVFANINDKVYYYIKDYISGKEDETLKSYFPDMPDLLELPHSVADMTKYLSTYKGAFDCKYIESFFPNLEKAVTFLNRKISPIKQTGYGLYDINDKPLNVRDYFNTDLKMLIYDSVINKFVIRYYLNGEIDPSTTVTVNNITDESILNNEGVNIDYGLENNTITFSFSQIFLNSNDEINITLKNDNGINFEDSYDIVPLTTISTFEKTNIKCTYQTKCYSKLNPSQEIDCNDENALHDDGWYRNIKHICIEPSYTLEGNIIKDNITGIEWYTDEYLNENYFDSEEKAENYCTSVGYNIPTIKDYQSIGDTFCSDDGYFDFIDKDAFYISKTLVNNLYFGFYCKNNKGNYKAICVKYNFNKSNIINIDEPLNLIYYHNENITYLDKSFTGTWEEAIKYCENLNYNGYSDWRLPNLNELELILDYNNYDPAVSDSFRNITSNIYFTSTSVGSYAKVINMRDGSWFSSQKSNTYNFICVRSGNSVQIEKW